MSIFTGQVLESRISKGSLLGKPKACPTLLGRWRTSLEWTTRPQSPLIYTLCQGNSNAARDDSAVQGHADTLIQGASRNSNMNRISAAGQRYRPGWQLDYCFYKMMTSFLAGLLAIATGTPWTRKQRSRASRSMAGHHRGRYKCRSYNCS